MKNKYLEYQDEILHLFENGVGFAEIARHLIDSHRLEVAPDYLRKQVGNVVRYLIADKEIVAYNIQLAKQKQRAQDLNRIANKSFRESARTENALVDYNKELISLLQKESLKTTIKNHKDKSKAALVVQIADTHFNELVDIDSNKYDFQIASKRLQKYAHNVKRYAEFYGVKNILIAITGDLINSDRRLDEKLSMSTNRAKATFLGVHLLKYFIMDLNEVANI